MKNVAEVALAIVAVILVFVTIAALFSDTRTAAMHPQSPARIGDWAATIYSLVALVAVAVGMFFLAQPLS